MKLLYSLLTLFLLLFNVGLAAKEETQHPASAPAGFTENKGQEKGPVLFKIAGTDQSVYVTAEGLTYVFSRSYRRSVNEEPDLDRKVEWSKLEMKLAGANIRKENITTENALPGYSNYYYAHCPQGILNVRTWKKVTISSIYPGIDWVLMTTEKGMEHDFIVHPGAEPSMIKLIYNGAASLVAQANSSRIKVSTAHGTLFEGDLKTYAQQSSGIIRSKFKVKGNEVTFALGNYNGDETIVIDPPLQWTAPQSSSGVTQAYSVSALRDYSGDVVVTGYTDATGYPTMNAYQGTFVADEDMIITRLNSSGALKWSTYYGGNNFDAGKGVATDNSGSVYVTGHTNSFDFPMLNNAQVQYANGYEVGIVKLDSAGVRQWATLYGGTSNDYGMAIDVDVNGDAYITGYTNSTNFPVVNAIQPTKNIAYDVLIMKMSMLGAVQWATYYGGDDDDKGRGIALDPAGTYLHITGSSVAGTFPTTSGVFQQYSASGYYADDAFIMKMDPSTQAVQWAAYCGGTDYDFGQGITVDNNNNIYVTGYTLSNDFPVVNPGNGAYIDSTLGSPSTHDAFIMMCNSTGTQRLWSTYFGGSGADLGLAVTFAANYGIYITGRAGSTDFPVQIPSDNVYYQPVQGDAGTMNDFFISWFQTDNSLQWSTYYGDADNEEGYGVDTDPLGNIFIAGLDANDVQVMKFEPKEAVGGIQSVNASAGITVYPDPVSSVLYADIDLRSGQQVQVRIIDMQGRQIKAAAMYAAKGKSTLQLNVEQLAAGNYLLEIKHDKGIMKGKFLKNKIK